MRPLSGCGPAELALLNADGSSVKEILICAFFGGAKEISNAVDAGTLNVGKKSFEVKVGAQSLDEKMQFKDLEDSQGQFGLTNINRVWGKALLSAANVAAMSNAEKTAQAQNNADKLFSAAEGISNRLADKLNTPANLHDYFTELSKQNSVRMVGKTATAEVQDGDWKTSLVNRGIESNLRIFQDQFPSADTYNAVAAVEKTVKGEAHKYVPGYKPISIGGHNFCLVPFKAEEKTCLISKGQFDDEALKQKPLPQWSNPVPNSFSCHGHTVTEAPYKEESIAHVLTNPQRTFKLEMPSAFIKIKLKEKSTAKWSFNGIPWPATTSYDYVIPENSTRGPGVAGLGTITGTCTFGLEYINKTVYGALFALPTENYDGVKNALVQRIKEIDPDFKAGDLQSLLSFPLLPAAADHDADSDNTVYVVFKSNGKLKCLPQPEAQAFALFDANFSKSADGNERKIKNESPLFVPGVPGVCWGTPVGFGTPKDLPDFMLIEGELHWKPGSGYDGCLGELRLERGTHAYVNGIVTFL
jgi:hypothetical protein